MKLTGFTLNKGTNKGDTTTVFITAQQKKQLTDGEPVLIYSLPKTVSACEAINSRH